MKLSRGSLVIFKAVIVFLLILSFAYQVQAISIRHDKNDQDYIDFGAAFPSVGGLYTGTQIRGSGVLISQSGGGSSRWVLTAAHITTPDKFIVNGVEYSVGTFTRHPDYDTGGSTGISTGLENDIAIVELISPVSGVTPLRWHDNDNDLTSGVEVISVGLGRFGDGNSGETGSAGTRRAAENIIASIGTQSPITPVSTAFEYRFFDPDGPNVRDLEGMGVLYDSGGPVLADFGLGNVVVGIHSYVRDNDGGGRGTYGDDLGSTRVPLYDEWIAQVIPEPSSFLLLLAFSTMFLLDRRLMVCCRVR